VPNAILLVELIRGLRRLFEAVVLDKPTRQHAALL
jgi:hypothetical protein